jgi:hypothetical protein
MERVKESEYGQCTLYMCKEKEQWNQVKLFRVGGGGWQRVLDEVNPVKIHYKHIWKCHKETHCITNI